MRIGIDGKPLTIPFPCGLRNYAENFINALLAIDTKNQYYIFSPVPICLPKKKNVMNVVGIRYIPWQLQLPLLVYGQHLDILHFLNQHGSLWSFSIHTIATVHDIPQKTNYPQFRENIFYGILYYYTSFISKITLFRCTHLIAVSHFTKSEIIKTGYKKNITVVKEGVSHRHFFPSYKSHDEKYVLVLADFSPRKNIMNVFAAYSKLPFATKRDYKLKVVVSNSQPYNKIQSWKHIYKLNARYIDIILSPNESDLTTLYQNASIFIYPSLYEGFGLPILEAMASGCPVITSHYGAMKEIAGNAAYVVNPYSVFEINRAMETLLRNPRLQKTLITKGLERAKKFTWKLTARKTLHIYEKVYRS